MARPLRHPGAGIPRHVVQRGNNRIPVFSDTQDFGVFREHLAECLERTGCLLHAYVFMTNHFHLLMTPTRDGGVSDCMRILGAKYVRYFNLRHERTGTLWQGRYKAALVNADSYIMACMRYIELNPVRAQMVRRPGDYRWSSYRANAGEAADCIVTPHSLFEELSSNPAARGDRYARWVAAGREDDPALVVIRSATYRCRGVRVD